MENIGKRGWFEPANKDILDCKGKVRKVAERHHNVSHKKSENVVIGEPFAFAVPTEDDLEIKDAQVFTFLDDIENKKFDKLIKEFLDENPDAEPISVQGDTLEVSKKFSDALYKFLEKKGIEASDILEKSEWERVQAQREAEASKKSK